MKEKTRLTLRKRIALLMAMLMLSITPVQLIDTTLTGPLAATAEAAMTTLPSYSGQPYKTVNNNIPAFSSADKSNTTAFEKYHALDSLGRCGTAYANICKETMPTGARGDISSVHPSGWQSNMGWERCHLIGYQLSAENANKQNLITGTHYFNVTGMLPFENMVADYVKETGNHVLYRVTPMFKGNNLVASGVQMEAWSVEDRGEGICFNVYVFNVQPGKTINYANGMVSSAVKQASTITLKDKTALYTGKTISIGKASVKGSTGKITYRYYSDKACTKQVTSHKKVGTYYVKATVAADANYKSATSKAAKLIITKKAQNITAAVLSKSYTASALKSSSKRFSMGIKTSSGKFSCKKTSGSSKLSVSSSGTVTVKRGTSAGTYSMKVKISAKASSRYPAYSVTKTVKVTVKKSTGGGSGSYVLNTNTKKFHRSSCSSVKRMSSANKKYASNRSSIIRQGYSPCKICKP